MECEESEDGRRPSLEERMQANMEKSALRRKSLRQARAQKKREESKILVEPPHDSVVEEVCTCVFATSDVVVVM